MFLRHYERSEVYVLPTRFTNIKPYFSLRVGKS